MGRFLRLTKSFRQCRSQHLMTKLEHYGFRGITGKWVTSYLIDRKQYVSVENVAFKPMPINCGVPQGSVLGIIIMIIIYAKR